MDLEKRIEELEKRVATLEGEVQEQQIEKFVSEDSNGKYYGIKESMLKPNRRVTF